ncbi:hypothetical protein N7491_002803 [Penicillium cf. griseofulvum]|uniref:Uncharacterized protein n=1 Tax=Penicillium cf. griseofulvum TaxID=2972120 RepID=A0A9W9T244_9EURO|nr:hypothetical protein N7472_003030 [Penicillium cf. griseofulvum]KAJ5440397.1 hypothetical protein N7491_002803 [Penicillium cf. griseofulvum]
MSEPENKTGSESNIHRIQERWESLNEMFQNTDPEPAEPVGSADDLEAEIRQAQAQLSRLKKQRELIDIKQKVAEEERELERARTRLLAVTTLEVPPATPASTPSRAEPKQNSRAGIDDAQRNIHPARSEQITTAPLTQAPDRRPSDAKPSESKPSPKPASLVSGLNLEQLRALAAATRSPAASIAIKTEPRSSLQPSTRSFHPESSGLSPPPPNVPVYNGRALGEFKNFSMGLERHFDKYPDWYKIEERKVSRALKHVALNIEDEWKRHLRHVPVEKVTYDAFCTFLIHQLQNGVYPDVARSRYMDSYQRPAQSVTDFSNWMQQWVPHFPNNDSERDRMRHLFEHLMNRVRNEADKTHLDFDNYYDFVEYLQRVEDSIGSRAESLGRRVINPRKRPRSHD